MTGEDVADWAALTGTSVRMAPADRPEPDQLTELRDALHQLLDGTLPHQPDGTPWLYGTPYDEDLAHCDCT